jgi:hypothetical protein
MNGVASRALDPAGGRREQWDFWAKTVRSFHILRQNATYLSLWLFTNCGRILPDPYNPSVEEVFRYRFGEK